MLKLSLINNILPTMPTCPPLFQSWIFTILFCCMCILLLFFSNFCTWVLGAHIFQGTNTHSPAAINLTPTFCRIFLLANHSLLRTSVLAWFGSKQFQLVSTWSGSNDFYSFLTTVLSLNMSWFDTVGNDRTDGLMSRIFRPQSINLFFSLGREAPQIDTRIFEIGLKA